MGAGSHFVEGFGLNRAFMVWLLLFGAPVQALDRAGPKDASILHRDVLVPAKPDAARLPDAFPKRAWPENVDLKRQTKARL